MNLSIESHIVTNQNRFFSIALHKMHSISFYRRNHTVKFMSLSLSKIHNIFFFLSIVYIYFCLRYSFYLWFISFYISKLLDIFAILTAFFSLFLEFYSNWYECRTSAIHESVVRGERNQSIHLKISEYWLCSSVFPQCTWLNCEGHKSNLALILRAIYFDVLFKWSCRACF